jgi:diguanylate cyclase (GGDEF)-like protein
VFSLAVLDLDRFKQYNDTLGHEAGDAVLKQIAVLLTEQLRSADSVFRYGGEEFACLLPMTGAEGARHAVERLCSSVLEVGTPHPGNPPFDRVTVSAGFASFDPAEPVSRDELFRMADAALYRAKREGRNRAIAA